MHIPIEQRNRLYRTKHGRFVLPTHISLHPEWNRKRTHRTSHTAPKGRGVIVLTALLTIAGSFYFSTQKVAPMIRPIDEQFLVRASEPVPTPTPKPKVLLYRGKVSYYSHAGCLGCGAKQIMGNGQPFNENAMTLAVPCEDILSKKIRYGTRVMVRNTTNGAERKAVISDCGGFRKYGRVADLSKGLMNILEARTDKDIIEIERI